MKIGKTPTKVSILEEKIVRKGFLTIQTAQISFEKFDGTLSRRVHRESLLRNDAVAGVLWDPDCMKILLVKQFRYPTFQKGPGWMIECVAGIIEDNETPEQAVIREIKEETGYQAENLQHVMTFFPSPSCSNERVVLFSGQLEQQKKEKIAYGGEDEAEDIQLIWLSMEEVQSLLNDQARLSNLDAKTILALYWWLDQVKSDSKISSVGNRVK